MAEKKLKPNAAVFRLRRASLTREISRKPSQKETGESFPIFFLVVSCPQKKTSNERVSEKE